MTRLQPSPSKINLKIQAEAEKVGPFAIFGDENVSNFEYFIMQVDKVLISKLEKLARLELSDEEKERIQEDLERILKMVGKLDELDLSAVDPLLQVFEQSSQLRADEVVDPLSVEQALKNAPKKQGPYFSVPKVIDQ
ncbi:MAG: Asp-tRNA(Asn)/Glu-tRNA(Gln) amidotransferase subunit GatC [Bacteroidota bacterium]